MLAGGIAVFPKDCRRTADDLHGHAAARAITAGHLTRESRDMFAWLSYFREWAHFDAYVLAVRTARQIFRCGCRTKQAIQAAGPSAFPPHAGPVPGPRVR
jgi:hypothetical protein